jgi:DNA-binding response OmpR family regulator
MLFAKTHEAMQGDKDHCLEAGCDDYIAKPILVPELINALQKCQRCLPPDIHVPNSESHTALLKRQLQNSEDEFFAENAFEDVNIKPKKRPRNIYKNL